MVSELPIYLFKVLTDILTVISFLYHISPLTVTSALKSFSRYFNILSYCSRSLHQLSSRAEFIPLLHGSSLLSIQCLFLQDVCPSSSPDDHSGSGYILSLFYFTVFIVSHNIHYMKILHLVFVYVHSYINYLSCQNIVQISQVILFIFILKSPLRLKITFNRRPLRKVSVDHL